MDRSPLTRSEGLASRAERAPRTRVSAGLHVDIDGHIIRVGHGATGGSATTVPEHRIGKRRRRPVVAAFVLTWNPSIDWADQREIDRTIEQTASGNRQRPSRWSLSLNASRVVSGDIFYMFRQKAQRGLVASGTFTGTGHTQGGVYYADILIERWVTPQDRVTIEQLDESVPAVKWIRLQASGRKLEPAEAKAVERLWKRNIYGVRTRPTPMPEEVPPGQRMEGALKRVVVNRYERDPRVREACLAHWGYRCSVCGFDFAETYGERGAGYIHVHHLIELSSMTSPRRVDPISDLRPVCPNCHAMLHTETPALTISQLRRIRNRVEEMRKG